MIKNNFEYDYKRLLRDVIHNGVRVDTRAGEALTSFGKSIDIDLNEGFPIVTGKKIFFNKALAEFNWMLSGDTSIKTLHKANIHYWDPFADKNGSVGKVYGYQLRHWNGDLDQITRVVTEIKNNSRRAILTFWNPTDLDAETLPSCYISMTFVKINDTLNMEMHLRSSDMSVGLPYDIVIGALFLHSIAKETELNVGKLKMNLSNAHVYVNTLSSVNNYLKNPIHSLPILDKYNLKLTGYKHSGFIKMKLNI